MLEGILVLGLMDTGASVTCLGFALWWCYHSQWGPLKPFEGTVHGALGKPLQIAGKTQHLDLQWGEARGLLHCHRGTGITTMPHWDGYYEASLRPHRRN